MLTGFKLRHIPTGLLLAQPFTSMTGALTFPAMHAPRAADQFDVEPVKLPCTCGKGFAPFCGVSHHKMSLAECDAQFCSICGDHAMGEWCCVECGAKEQTP